MAAVPPEESSQVRPSAQAQSGLPVRSEASRAALKARDIACTTKKRHPTKSAAKKVLKKLKGRGDRTLVIYRCWHCDLFHIGHKPGQQTYIRRGRPLL